MSPQSRKAPVLLEEMTLRGANCPGRAWGDFSVAMGRFSESR